MQITTRNIAYYRDKGYKCCVGETIEVSQEKVYPTAKIKECRICDFCGDVYIRNHELNVNSFNRFGRDVCPVCYRTNKEIKKKIQEKREATFVENYGVSNPMFVPEIAKKIEETLLERYGERNPSLIEEFKKKQEETMINLYGARKAL